MKKILVPTDFSKAGKRALEIAVQIASKSNAEIVLLNVMDMPAYLTESQPAVSYVSTVNDFVKEFKQESDAKLKEAIESSSYGQITSTMTAGVPTDSILEQAKKTGADLIVMGTQGASGMKEWIVGSNTEKLVRFSEVPVLTVNEKAPDFHLENIVLMSDFQKDEFNDLEVLKKIQSLFGAKLHLVRINTPQNFENSPNTKSSQEAFVEQHGLENYTLNQYSYNHLEDGLFHFARDVSGDLIAMGTHGRRGISHLFLGSKTEDIVNHSLLPILTIKFK